MPEATKWPVTGYALHTSFTSVPKMTRSILRVALFGAALSALPLLAGASSFAGTSAGSASGASSNSSGSSSGDDKVILAARDDAAAFVASDGRIRGAHLQAALVHLREQDEAARQADDLELARTLLAY